MTQEMVRGFSLFEEALLVSEAQEPNVEQCIKDAAAVQNAIQCYHVIYNEKKRATTQSSLDHFFKWVQSSSVAQSCPTLCDPMACSSPCFPVHHQLPELTQTHVKWVDRVESSKEPEPVPSTSGMSEITACPPLFADDPSALPSPTLSLLQAVTLACSLDASASMPGVVLYYCTFKVLYCKIKNVLFLVFVFYVLFV
ncbi:unnamed protein product [Rangifer tarandus platyrhynchus]|uniref:Uncharacterized protein n=2 Tax=Rangifer tarandus platyrhynchus TaxID=3082113 RepID=A0ABN8XZ13_RANTA|nr:unnamed protein product [Rangifer tarandus platyrhynchus]